MYYPPPQKKISNKAPFLKLNYKTPLFLQVIGKYGVTVDLQSLFYVLLPNIIYAMQPRRFSQYPAYLSWMAKERDKKYIVQSP
jgi:hypothetical protein